MLKDFFFVSNEISFFILFVYIMYTVIDFFYIDLFFSLWEEAYLIMVDDVFDLFLDLVFKYVTGYFCVYAH